MPCTSIMIFFSAFCWASFRNSSEYVCKWFALKSRCRLMHWFSIFPNFFLFLFFIFFPPSILWDNPDDKSQRRQKNLFVFCTLCQWFPNLESIKKSWMPAITPKDCDLIVCGVWLKISLSDSDIQTSLLSAFYIWIAENWSKASLNITHVLNFYKSVASLPTLCKVSFPLL